MSVRSMCICGSALKRAPFSQHFDALVCSQCLSRHFVARPGVGSVNFEYGSKSEKYSRREYLYGKQLRWAHRRLLERQWVGRKVLEVGCFNGFFLDELRKAGAEVYGVDVNTDALEVGRSLYGLEGRLHNSLDLASRTKPFDDIVCIDVLEHLAEPEKTLTTLADLLSAGGQVVIGGPTIERRFHDRSDYPPHHLWWFSRPGLTSACRLVGLDVTETLAQHDVILLARNFVGKVLHGLARKEFFGDSTVSPPAVVDGILVSRVAEAINDVISGPLRRLGFSYCSTILIAKKAARARGMREGLVHGLSADFHLGSK